MSVHYAAWSVFYFMASMTTVMASEVRSVTYTTTHHLTPSGFDDWTVRLSTRLSSAIKCALQCARQTHCVQFQWDDGLCHLNAKECHGFCAILHTPGCQPLMLPTTAESKIQHPTTDGRCYVINDFNHKCLTSHDRTVSGICRNGRMARFGPRTEKQCLVFNFTERTTGHFTAQLVGTDLFLWQNASATHGLMAVKVEKTDPDLVDFTFDNIIIRSPVYKSMDPKTGRKRRWFFYRHPKCE